MPEPPVTLITAEGCPWCARAREFFARRGSTVTERDYLDTPEAFRESLKLAGETVTPVVVIGVEVHVGYDEARWTEMLEAPLPPAPPPEALALDFLDEDDDQAPAEDVLVSVIEQTPDRDLG